MSDDIKTRPQSKEYDEGYQRTFGSRPIQRGRWVWDKRQGKLVSADEYVPEDEGELAIHAGIMVDRYMEGTVSPVDGSDIGSRAKRRAHLKLHGLADYDDFSDDFRARVKKEREREQDRKRKEAMHQALRKLYAEGKVR